MLRLLALLAVQAPTVAAPVVHAPVVPPSAVAADLVVTNARVYTADDARPLVEAFAVRGGRVVFTGSAREAKALTGANTRVVDAGGRTVIPGMVDGHAHFAG
ncbi:MAG: amidohydrolase, partial [Gemmatimonas sp.]